MLRILVIDNNKSAADAMARLFRHDGHEVEHCTSGLDAIAALRSGRPFDAVVTDAEVRAVDGGVVIQAARECSPDACIVVTHAGRADPRRLRDAGACVVIQKPISYDAVQSTIARCQAHGGQLGPQCARRSPGLIESLIRPRVRG
jgi:two-component system OmpR family response regulator